MGFVRMSIDKLYFDLKITGADSTDSGRYFCNLISPTANLWFLFAHTIIGKSSVQCYM